MALMIDKLAGIRGDLVRTDSFWENWTFDKLTEALRLWTRRNPIGKQEDRDQRNERNRRDDQNRSDDRNRCDDRKRRDDRNRCDDENWRDDRKRETPPS